MLLNDGIQKEIDHNAKAIDQSAIGNTSLAKASLKKVKTSEQKPEAQIEQDSPKPKSESDDSQSMQQHHSDIEDGYKEFLDSQEDEACVAYEAKKKARNDIVPEEDEKEELDAFEGDNVFIDNLPKKK